MGPKNSFDLLVSRTWFAFLIPQSPDQAKPELLAYKVDSNLK